MGAELFIILDSDDDPDVMVGHAYAAKSVSIARAKGELILIHDSDDDADVRADHAYAAKSVECEWISHQSAAGSTKHPHGLSSAGSRKSKEALAAGPTFKRHGVIAAGGSSKRHPAVFTVGSNKRDRFDAGSCKPDHFDFGSTYRHHSDARLIKRHHAFSKSGSRKRYHSDAESSKHYHSVSQAGSRKRHRSDAGSSEGHHAVSAAGSSKVIQKLARSHVATGDTNVSSVDLKMIEEFLASVFPEYRCADGTCFLVVHTLTATNKKEMKLPRRVFPQDLALTGPVTLLFRTEVSVDGSYKVCTADDGRLIIKGWKTFIDQVRWEVGSKIVMLFCRRGKMTRLFADPLSMPV